MVRCQGLEPERNEIVFLDPRQIVGNVNLAKYRQIQEAMGCRNGIILPSNRDWTCFSKREIQSEDFFISCKMRWVDGVEWEETAIFQKYLNRIRQGAPAKEAKTEEALRKRYRRLDRIYESVRKNGFDTSTENLVLVSLDQGGDLYWGPDGRHRLAMGILLNVEAMPFCVSLVHQDALDHFQSIRLMSRAHPHSHLSFRRGSVS